jgi:tetratricopeptide (TPR) repeat protein
VFLGVGSGSGSGLSDVFNNIFTGSSGPSISKLQDKVAKNPRDAAALLELGQALQGKQRTDEAIAAYQQYVALRPKSIQGLTSLAALYNAKAQAQYSEAQSVASTAQSANPEQLLGSSPFTGSQNSITKSLGDQASQQLSTAYSSYLSTVQESLGVYQKIAKLTPDEPSALINVAQTAQLAGESQTELTAYKSFLKRFPDDPLAPDVRRQVKQLEKTVKSAGQAGQSPTG